MNGVREIAMEAVGRGALPAAGPGSPEGSVLLVVIGDEEAKK